MHIIIPMSGIGKRFLSAAYKSPKPLIRIEDKPIIGHVIEMFPGENKITFICNKEHIHNTSMKKELFSYAPNSSIVEIEPHKLGPVYAVSKVFDRIEDKEEVIVNYCDFTCDWDYENFKESF